MPHILRSQHLASVLSLSCLLLYLHLWCNTSRQHQESTLHLRLSWVHRASTTVSYAVPAQILEYLAPAFVAYAATLSTVTGGFGLSLSNPPSSVDHACRVLCIHVHSATVAVVLWLNFRLLICNEVHCAAPRCLRWFASQLPRRLSAAASTALSWVTGSCCQVSCSTFLCVAFICPCERRRKKTCITAR